MHIALYTSIFRSTVKNGGWSAVKKFKFIIEYSEYEYESKFSKLKSMLKSTAT